MFIFSVCSILESICLRKDMLPPRCVHHQRPLRGWQPGADACSERPSPVGDKHAHLGSARACLVTSLLRERMLHVSSWWQLRGCPPRSRCLRCAYNSRCRQASWEMVPRCTLSSVLSRELLCGVRFGPRAAGPARNFALKSAFYPIAPKQASCPIALWWRHAPSRDQPHPCRLRKSFC